MKYRPFVVMVAAALGAAGLTVAAHHQVKAAGTQVCVSVDNAEGPDATGLDVTAPVVGKLDLLDAAPGDAPGDACSEGATESNVIGAQVSVNGGSGPGGPPPDADDGGVPSENICVLGNCTEGTLVDTVIRLVETTAPAAEPTIDSINVDVNPTTPVVQANAGLVWVNASANLAGPTGQACVGVAGNTVGVSDDITSPAC